MARLTAARLNARVTALEGELADATAAKEGLEGVCRVCVWERGGGGGA